MLKRKSMKLGDLLRSRTTDAADKTVKKEISKLFKCAYSEAQRSADDGKRNASISINTAEYDDEHPLFDYTYDSSLLIDKVVPEVIKMFQNESITATLENSPEGMVKHWILKLSW